MNGLRQGWLVAAREMRERGRSRAFRVSALIMMLIVLGVILVPAMIRPGERAKHVGLAGVTANRMPDVIQRQSAAVGPTATVQHYDNVAAGETAVRDGDIDVLVVDDRRLEWRRQPDPQLQAIVAGAIQMTAV